MIPLDAEESRFRFRGSNAFLSIFFLQSLSFGTNLTEGRPSWSHSGCQVKV